MDNRMKLSKDFIGSIPSKKELKKIIDDIPLSKEDKLIIEDIIVDKMSVDDVMEKRNVSISTVKRRTRDFHLKVYDKLFTGKYEDKKKVYVQDKVQ